MKLSIKIFVITALIFVGVSLVKAQTSSFLEDLRVGASGSTVSALQQWLMDNDFDIPAISSGTAVKGYFGAQTKKAVQAYQSSVGLPNTGFFGPLTRASINNSNTPVSSTVTFTSKPVQCPVGYTCTPQPGTTVPTTPSTPGVITTPGVGGTLAVSLQGSPSGASLDKGETEDVARYKLQAASSDMQVTSVALDFDVRFWLYASSVTIKDDSGNVVAQKNNLSQADFSELTVGSDYRLYIPTNYVVPATQTRYFTVSVSMLPITDRDSGTLTINDAQFRAVDGTGVTDTQSVTDDRTFTYTGSNSAQVVITLNDQSPPDMVVPISSSARTENVVMGVANFMSKGRDGVLRSVQLYVSTNGTNPTSVFDDVKIQSGNLIYSADSIGNGINYAETTNFTDMAIPLPKDTNVPIAVLVTVKKNVNNALDGVVASTTLSASGTAGGTSNNPVVEDSTFTTIDINDAPIATSDITFSESDANLFSDAPNAVLGSPISNNNVTVAYPVSFSFTITAGINTLYVSADPVVALATTSTGYGSVSNASTTITAVSVYPDNLAGDSSGSYYVVPPGGSRKFTWTGTIKNDPPRGVTLKTFKITGIKYGTSSGDLDANTIVYYNYGVLKVEPVI